MSIQNARAAVDKMKSDSSFKQQVLSIPDTSKKIEFLGKAGFQCTIEELQGIAAPDNPFNRKCGEHVIPLAVDGLKA